MDFSYDEIEEAFRKVVKEFCAKEISPRLKEMEEREEIPDDILKGIAKLGLFGVNISPEYGGAGAGFVNSVVAAEEIGYADVSLSIAIFPYLIENAFGFVVDKYGTNQVKEEILPKILAGENILGVAATEPHCGNDLAAMKTTAKKENGYYIINGEKAYISGIAEVQKYGGGFLTLTFTAPELKYRGMTLLYVPLNASGIESTLYSEVGKRGSSYGGFKMTNTRVPEYRVIGELGKGIYLTLEGISRARTMMTMAAIGAARRCLEIGMDYAKQRTVFGNPIASYQGIQFELADDFTKLEAARLLVYRTAWLIDKAQHGNKAARHEIPSAVAMVKSWVPRIAYDAINHALMWHGAYGYTKECTIEMGLRGVLALLTGAGGTENAMKLVIARSLLGEEFVQSA